MKLKSTYFGFRIISAVNCCTIKHAFLLKTGEAYTISCKHKQFRISRTFTLSQQLRHELNRLTTSGADPGFQKGGGGWMADHIY